MAKTQNSIIRQVLRQKLLQHLETIVIVRELWLLRIQEYWVDLSI